MAEIYAINLALLKDRYNVISEVESRGEALNVVESPLKVIGSWWFPSGSTWVSEENLIMKLNEREFSIIYRPEIKVITWSFSERGTLFPSYIKPEVMGIAAGGAISVIGFSIACVSGNLLGALVLFGPLVASIIGLVSVLALARETA